MSAPAVAVFGGSASRAQPASALGRPEPGTLTLAALRHRLASLAPAPRPDGAGLATGLAALDALLPARGIPRGRLTEIVGTRGSGKTTLVRHLVVTTIARGLWAAVIDTERTLAPRDWAPVAGSADAHHPLWVIRPDAPAKGAWCADVLLRSGAFALVVLDGGSRRCAPLSRAVGVRLTKLAREAGTAFVLLREDDEVDAGRRPAMGSAGSAGSAGGAGGAGGALRLRVARAAHRDTPPRSSLPLPLPLPLSPGQGRNRRGREPRAGSRGARAGAATSPEPAARRRMMITMEKGGSGSGENEPEGGWEGRGGGGRGGRGGRESHRTIEVSYVAAVARRLCAHPEVPDRRGVARSDSADERRPAIAARSGGDVIPLRSPDESLDTRSRVLARKRRCAEPPPGLEERKGGPLPARPRAGPRPRTAAGVG